MLGLSFSDLVALFRVSYSFCWLFDFVVCLIVGLRACKGTPTGPGEAVWTFWTLQRDTSNRTVKGSQGSGLEA